MTELPPLADLMAVRLELRKQARSGNPAKRALAEQRLPYMERMIADAKALDAKTAPEPFEESA